MKVILVSGKAQHGKDTMSEMLRDILVSSGNKVLVTHYADLLKYICKNYFNWDGNKDERGRALLQYVGTDVIRKQNPKIWVDFVAQMLTYFNGFWDYVIIPDCRFPDEISVMKEKGFDVLHVKVMRTGFKSNLTKEQQMHPSEIALDDISPDFTITNDGTIDALREAIIKFVEEYLSISKYACTTEGRWLFAK